MTKRNTKKALVVSLLSLLLCCSMLVGTTFAWFTDSVQSGNNKIVAGNLDVELYYKLKTTDQWQKVTGNTELFDDDVLWEPGFTQVVYLKIVNEGTLALKYQIGMNVVAETVGKTKDGKDIVLSNHIMYGTKEYATEAELPTTREAARTAITGKAIYDQYEHPVWNNGELEADKNAPDLLTVVAYMPESVGNEANHNGTNVPSIQLGLNLTATQLAAENDSFGTDYDTTATLPKGGSGSVAAPEDGTSGVEVTVRDASTNAKVATFTVPAGAIADDAEQVKMDVEPTAANANITVTADEEIATFEVTATGLKEGNTEPVKVQLRLIPGLDPATVSLYHYEEKIPCTYDPTTGYVTFETATFSPFSVVYDAESVYVPPVTDGKDLPTAIVTDADEHENVTLDWGGFGPVPEADANQTLEAVYKFAAPHDSSTVADCEYKGWYCDYVVMIDRDITANSIFLGGNYGSFGWVGFNNPEAVKADQEVYLLGSVTSSPWTYENVVGFVGEFLCGVGTAVGDAEEKTDLEGAIFTVMLRLTNPENENEYYNVNTVTYKFPTHVTTGEGLQDAINNGDGNIVLDNDIELSQGIVIPGN